MALEDPADACIPDCEFCDGGKRELTKPGRLDSKSLTKRPRKDRLRGKPAFKTNIVDRFIQIHSNHLNGAFEPDPCQIFLRCLPRLLLEDPLKMKRRQIDLRRDLAEREIL